MRIAIGADHAGLELKHSIMGYLEKSEYQIIDVGTYSTESVDYPDYAEAVGRKLIEGSADRGILICCSGVGASVAASKIPGIRAGLCHDTYSAHQGVEHDDMNILVLGSCVVGSKLAIELVQAFLGAAFTGEERYQRRLEKIQSMEKRYHR
ncbi:MAG: ribose 5-phosphate isomerase B [Candidatus Kuenenia sp.]|nr:ribose 5-phosphate isomerase B [Candidatus Kuenenia hertensis]